MDDIYQSETIQIANELHTVMSQISSIGAVVGLDIENILRYDDTNLIPEVLEAFTTLSDLYKQMSDALNKFTALISNNTFSEAFLGQFENLFNTFSTFKVEFGSFICVCSSNIHELVTRKQSEIMDLLETTGQLNDIHDSSNTIEILACNFQLKMDFLNNIGVDTEEDNDMI
jgi:hypothetical protein